MMVFHSTPTEATLKKCDEAAPLYEHGATWSPARMSTTVDRPYILENGAWHCYVNEVPWNPDPFLRRLTQIGEEMPREPEFVVLPDIIPDPELTEKRSEAWAPFIDYDTAYPVQDGVHPEDGIETAQRLGATTVFVGGTKTWKREYGPVFVEQAHEAGLDCHIARPGSLVWAEEAGADSVDTSSIVRNDSFDRLEGLNEHGRASSEQYYEYTGGGA